MAWTSVDVQLPDEGRFCFLFDDKSDTVWIGTREYVVDAEGWAWTNSYGNVGWYRGQWQGDAEWDCDYTPTHWDYLPVPPCNSSDSRSQETRDSSPGSAG